MKLRRNDPRSRKCEHCRQPEESAGAGQTNAGQLTQARIGNPLGGRAHV